MCTYVKVEITTCADWITRKTEEGLKRNEKVPLPERHGALEDTPQAEQKASVPEKQGALEDTYIVKEDKSYLCMN
jgi:transposase